MLSDINKNGSVSDDQYDYIVHKSKHKFKSIYEYELCEDKSFAENDNSFLT